MLLRVFEKLYPKQMNLNGEPTGLETSTTKLTAYNGMQIPQYVALRCLIIWRPGNGAKPRCIQTKWYVADMPGPAILGLPTSDRLKVITINCAVRITHELPKLLDKKSHNVIRHDGTSPHPLAQTSKSGHISSKEQLIKDYWDHFEGIGRFPGTYKIHLKNYAKPVIHPQLKWPISMWLKLKPKLNQMEKMA